jgi:hypothetical protein
VARVARLVARPPDAHLLSAARGDDMIERPRDELNEPAETGEPTGGGADRDVAAQDGPGEPGPVPRKRRTARQKQSPAARKTGAMSPRGRQKARTGATARGNKKTARARVKPGSRATGRGRRGAGQTKAAKGSSPKAARRKGNRGTRGAGPGRGKGGGRSRIR